MEQERHLVTKGERREKQRQKRRRGMKVVGRSVKLLLEVIAKKASNVIL